METISQLIALVKAHAWQSLFLYLVFGLVSLALAKRSQIDHWAESNPRIAGAMKLLRGLGLDPWLIVQGVFLLVKGKLPPPPARKLPLKGSDILPTLGLCVFAALAVGCASVPPSFKSVATEAGARNAAMTACSLSHSFDGKIAASEAVLKFCSKAEFAEPWIELAKNAAAIVEAQRAGKPRPDPEPSKPEPVPAPPPVPPSEPAGVPRSPTEA